MPDTSAAPSSTATAAESPAKTQDITALPRMSLLLTLSSGRQISFSEGGDRAGIPVIFIPGVTGNRLWTAVYDELAREHGIRFITFDRPGRGVSEPPKSLKEWSFQSWGDYLNELTDILDIPRFFLLAHSCGACYALAAYPTIKDKVIGAIRVLAIWVPTNLPCMPASYALTRSLPTSMVRGMLSLSSTAKSVLPFMSAAAAANQWQMGVIGHREEDQSGHTRRVLKRIGQENMGSDYKAYEADWLLSLEITKPIGISYTGAGAAIKCWHGMDDTMVPLGAAMWLQREMKKFLLFAVEGATHNILLDMSIMRAVFADIVKEATDVRLETFHAEQKAQRPSNQT